MSHMVIKCQSPQVSEFFSVIYKSGNGGYQCNKDMIPRSRIELVGNNDIKLQLLRSSFKNAYMSHFGKECNFYFV